MGNSLTEGGAFLAGSAIDSMCVDCPHLLVVKGGAEEPLMAAAFCLSETCERNIKNVKQGSHYPLLRCPSCGRANLARREGLPTQKLWCPPCGKEFDVPDVLPPECAQVITAIREHAGSGQD
jgi:ribosomal protein L37AE/L43A